MRVTVCDALSILCALVGACGRLERDLMPLLQVACFLPGFRPGIEYWLHGLDSCQSIVRFSVTGSEHCLWAGTGLSTLRVTRWRAWRCPPLCRTPWWRTQAAWQLPQCCSPWQPLCRCAHSVTFRGSRSPFRCPDRVPFWALGVLTAPLQVCSDCNLQVGLQHPISPRGSQLSKQVVSRHCAAINGYSVLAVCGGQLRGVDDNARY